MPINIRVIRLLVVCISCILSQACLLKRIEKSKDDLCQGQVSFDIEQGYVIFSHPRLYKKDIAVIMAEKPHKEFACGNGICQDFISFRERYPDEKDYFLVTRYYFEAQSGKRYKLYKIIFSQNILQVVPNKLITQFFNSNVRCQADINRQQGTAVINFPVKGLHFPNLNDLQKHFGAADVVDRYHYVYRYLSQDQKLATMAFKAQDKTSPLTALTFDFYNYKIDIDLNKGVAKGTIKDKSKMIRLAFFW